MCWDLALDIIDGKNTIDSYLDKGIDINYEEGLYLEIAVRYNHLGIVKHLVSKGIDINSKNSYALIIAIENNHTTIAKYLVDQGVNLYINLVYLASECNSIDILKLLVKKGLSFDTLTCVKAAAKAGAIKVLKYLFKNNSGIIYHSIRTHTIEAARAGYLTIVKYFIELSPGVTTLNFLLSQAMTGSCQGDKLNIVKYVIKYYIEYFSAEDLNKFYILAIQKKCSVAVFKVLDSTKKIITNGKALEIAVEYPYSTFLTHYLVTKCEVEDINKAFIKVKSVNIATFLIKNGADIHYNGEEVLKNAILHNNRYLTEYFINKGSVVNINNEEPLRLALSSNVSDEILELLIDNGANIDIAADIILLQPDPDINTLSALSRLFDKEIIQQYFIIDTECGICLTEFKNESRRDSFFICNVCKHAVHKKCQKKWKGKCIYCRN